MGKLQNNFTTPEQSKRLLELGVPIDSADMYYKQYSEAVVWVGEVRDVPQPKTYYINEPVLRHIIPEGTWTYKDGERIDLSGKIDELRKTDIPCWSVGRLIEIIKICSIRSEPILKILRFIDNTDDIVAFIVHYLGYETQIGRIDFSKLEN